MSNLQEVKGNLARLLATENLTVEHKVCQTASFDTDKRILTLPIWNVSDHVYDMLVEHEVGHALFTPNDDWTEVLKDVPKSFLNVTEDARIEKLMKRKFPGVNKDFFKGYKELHEEDFFSVKHEDVTQLHLIDRINLHYKIGTHFMLPFADAEIPLRDAVGVAETFDQAIQCAIDIYNYEKQEQEKEELQTPQEGNSSVGNTPDSTESAQGEGDEIEVEGKPKSQGDSDQEEGDTQGESEEENTPSPIGGYEAGDLYAKTDVSLEENLIESTLNSEYQAPKYIEMPELDSKSHMTSPEWVADKCEEWWNAERFTDVNYEYHTPLDWSYIDAEYTAFKKQIGREVSYLNKEFEMKKAATSYARASISRTGVLDTKKLFSYKYNDDIFRKVTRTKDGKSHGLIFILDWSGSLHECILDTYKQLLSLAFFCRKAKISFEAFCFASDTGDHLTEDYDDKTYASKQKDNTIYVPAHQVLQGLFNSNQNNAEFDRSAKTVFRIASVYVHNRYYGWSERPNVPETSAIPNILQMGGTPLNESLCILNDFIPKFRKQHGVEKVNVALLTDGEAQWSRRWQTIDYRDGKHRTITCIEQNTQLRHRQSAQTFKTEGAYRLTEAVLRYCKACHPYVNFLGFRLGSTRDIFYTLDRYMESDKIEKMRKVWKKNRAVSCKVAGYDEHYFLCIKSMNDDSSFEVAEEATNAEIKRAFQKSLKVKANNKSILSSFIKQIA